jgi:hypothetical protein
MEKPRSTLALLDIGSDLSAWGAPLDKLLSGFNWRLNFTTFRPTRKSPRRLFPSPLDVLVAARALGALLAMRAPRLTGFSRSDRVGGSCHALPFSVMAAWSSPTRAPAFARFLAFATDPFLFVLSGRNLRRLIPARAGRLDLAGRFTF